MSKYKIRKTIASVLVSVSTVVALSGGSLLVPMVASAQTDQAALIAQLQAQILALQAQLNALVGGGSAPASSGSCSFTRDLTLGSKGDDVTCLQNYLTGTGHFTFAGGATGYFGSITKAAVAAPAAQVTNSLAPFNSVHVPFTKFTLTAGASDVTVSGVTVERVGYGVDANFAGIVLLDDNSVQMDIEKTLGSDHRATIGGTFKVPAGMTKTYTVAGNMEAQATVKAGQVVAISVVAINTTETVSGTLPITGAAHTINATLTIGSVTMQRGALDPGSSATKEVGTTGYTFSSVRVTAGSAEKVYLKSIRWNQTGSAGSGDLTNIKTYVDGTAYDNTVSSDGKYYTAVFPENSGKGLLIDKGFSKEISIKGDIASGSGRTADFDLAKRTDILLVGENYNFGIKAPQTGTSDPTDDTAAFSSVEDPWYDAAQVTISAGTINVAASNSVSAQNIAVNVNNTPLGSFTVDVKGEEITVASMTFQVTLASNGGADVDALTNVSLMDETGAVVAGPVDGSATDSTSDGTVPFTSTITFKQGVHIYKLVGKLGTAFPNNATVQASTTPSGWGTVRGLTSGNSITPTPNSAVTLNQMTVKGGTLAVSVSSVPIAQSVIAGSNGFLFANYILDASGSGEDLRMTSLPLAYEVTAGSANNLSSCQLYDGSTPVTSGSNIKNPTAAGSSTAFTFDSTGLSIPKGASKTLALKCNVGGGLTTGRYIWGLDSGQQSSYSGVSGLTSGSTSPVTFNDATGQAMTIATGGTMTVVLDANSPAYKIASANQTGVELSRIKFSAANEDIKLKQVALRLVGVASNTPIDLVGRKVTLWDGTKQIGEAVFSTGDFATSSTIAEGDFTIPRDGSKVMIVKGDIANISVSGPLTQAGDLLIVDYDEANVGLNGTYGTGGASGSTVNGSTSNVTNPAGVRVMKSYPTLAHVALSSAQKTLAAGSTANQKFYRFSVTANGGDVYLYKWTFNMGSSTLAATTSLYSLYAFTSSDFSNEDSAFAAQGLINNSNCFSGLVSTAAGPRNVEIYPDKTGCNTATTTYVVPSGVTRYFELRGTVATVESGTTNIDSITVSLDGDAAYPVPQNDGANSQNTFAASIVDVDTNDDFIWSPNSTTTNPLITDEDFANGYQLSGLPSTGMNTETLQSN